MESFLIDQAELEASVRIMGDLTAVTVPELQAGLKQALHNGARELEFDLSRTAMLDSSGIGLLIATANSLAPIGGKIRVSNVSPDIFRLLRSMRLTVRLNVSGRAG